MEITRSVGKNPKESSSMTASTISGYKALNCGKERWTNPSTGNSLDSCWGDRNLTRAAMFPPVKDTTQRSGKHSVWEQQVCTLYQRNDDASVFPVWCSPILWPIMENRVHWRPTGVRSKNNWEDFRPINTDISISINVFTFSLRDLWWCDTHLPRMQ